MADAITESTPVLALLKTVFASILEVFLVCLAGWILARRGILDKKTQKQINRLNVSLFTPCLLFSKVAFFLTPEKLRELWVIPIMFCVVTIVSMLVAMVLGWLMRLKRSQRSFAMAAAMFMNSNSLPIALMQSLVITVTGLKWGADDTHNAMLGRALTYLVLYSTLGMVLRWSYGVHLLSQADDEEPQPSNDDEPASETDPLLPPQPPTEAPSRNVSSHTLRTQPSVTFTHVDDSPSPSQTISRTSTNENLAPLNIPKGPTGINGKSHFFYSFPNTPRMSMASLPSPPRDDDDDDDEDAVPKPKPKPGFLKRAWKKLNAFMTVPLWAALASIIVACVPPLQHALETHIKPVKGSVSQLGNCSIPLTLIVLGGYFYTPPEDAAAVNLPQTRHPRLRSESSLVGKVREAFTKLGRQKRKNRKIRAGRVGETRTVFVAIFSRMIVTPLLLLPLMAVFAKWDLQRVFADPVFVVSNVLLIASPPALTLAQITQAASGEAFERLISRTIFWAYCILTPITTILYVVLGLVLANL